LVVDDEPNVLRALSYALTREGYSVRTASSGADGLRLLRTLRPPLVLLDVMMPGKDGYEVCKEIRQDPELWDTYVTLLTARGQQADRERGLFAGADEYVVKPFSVRALIKLMQELLSQVLTPHHARGGVTKADARTNPGHLEGWASSPSFDRARKR